MTFFSFGMGEWPLITTGVIQGFGLGFVFIPLSTVAFQTLDVRLRTEASGLFNLVRNLGSSIGISIMAALLISNMQTNHATLAEHINPFNPNLPALGIDPGVLATQAGAQTAAQIDGMITAQSLMIAYLDDFKLMFYITLCSVPLLLLLRYKKMVMGGPQMAPQPAAAAMAD
jgi:DHA2 family multidrug resistance protein